MSPCVNGTSRSFFCAKSFPAAPTKVTAYRWPVLPVCLKKSSIARKKFLPIWKVLAVLRQNQSREEENRPSRCQNPKSRSWICCECAHASSGRQASSLSRPAAFQTAEHDKQDAW